MRHTVLFALLMACSNTPTEMPATPTGSLDAAELTAHVESFVGPWFGQADPTPMGAIPFGFTFEAEGDTIEAVADNGMGFVFTLTFTEVDDTWMLTETGELPGGFSQSTDLDPVAMDEGGVMWVSRDDPSYLTVQTSVSGDQFMLDAIIREERHTTLDLSRP